MTPTGIPDVFAALMLAVAAVTAARLVAARPWRRGSVVVDADVAHLPMAIAMAGMLAPSLRTFPDVVWEVIFGVMVAWFAFRVLWDARSNGVRALAGGHCAPHLVHSGSMLYMLLALTAPATGVSEMTGMAGPSGSSGTAMQALSHPTLAFVFALILVGYTIWDLDQLSGGRYGLTVSLAGITAAGATVAGATATGVTGQVLLSLAVTVGCRVALGVAMAFMLLIAI